MITIHSFFFMCSVRCGSIFIGVVTFTQAIILLMMVSLNYENANYVADCTLKTLQKIKIYENIVEFLKIRDGAETYMISFGVLCGLLLLSSTLVIIGAYQCKRNYMYPFLIFFGVFIVLGVGFMVLLIFFFKANNLGLGHLIFYSNLMVFIFIFYLYKWACVYSFIHIIDNLERRLDDQMKLKKPTPEIKVLYKNNLYHR